MITPTAYAFTDDIDLKKVLKQHIHDKPYVLMIPKQLNFTTLNGSDNNDG